MKGSAWEAETAPAVYGKWMGLGQAHESATAISQALALQHAASGSCSTPILPVSDVPKWGNIPPNFHQSASILVCSSG